MNIEVIQLEMLLKEALFGLCVMGIVTVFNIYAFVELALTYSRILKQGKFHGRHYEMLRFVVFIMLLVVAMLMSLAIWVMALTYFEFVSDWVTALLFAASFFTSVGNFTVSLPVGWRLVPSIIAFSGLFSFAWATASSISMARTLKEYQERHKQV